MDGAGGQQTEESGQGGGVAVMPARTGKWSSGPAYNLLSETKNGQFSDNYRWPYKGGQSEHKI